MPTAVRPPRNERWTGKQWWYLLRGFINALVVGGMLVQFLHWLHKAVGGGPSQDGYYGLGVIFIPLIMGAVASWSWEELEPGTWQLGLWLLLTTLLGIFGLWVLGFEGVVCLIMALPLLWGLMAFGGYIPRALRRRGANKLRVNFIPLLLVLSIADCFTEHIDHRIVTTEMRVDAPPSAIYPHIIAFPPITEPSRFWLCRFGLPYPVESTVSAPAVGASRLCRLSGGIDIGERITRLDSDREIDFDITQMPRYPELADHATLERGRIRIQDNGDGTSTLIGTSWYALRVSPSLYFGPWADYLVHDVHGRVFEHIKSLSEASSASSQKRAVRRVAAGG